MEHEWFRTLVQSKSQIHILEICSGMGIGGVALAKVLNKRGIDVKLTLTDLRENALKVAEEWGRKEIKREVHTVKVDARKNTYTQSKS